MDLMRIFYLLLIVSTGGCKDKRTLETKTVRFMDDVNLTCAREDEGSLFWIRLVPGAFPQVLGKPAGYGISENRFQLKQPRGRFDLQISKAELNDTGVYICLKTLQHNFMFLTGVDLRFEAPEPAVTDPIILTNSTASPTSANNKTEENSHQISLGFKCRGGNIFDECDKNIDGQSAKKCVISFFKNISSSDDGTYYCAVASCEETVSVNGSEHNNGALNEEKQDTTVVFVLSAALALSLFVLAFLIYSVKRLQNKTCDCCKASVVLQTPSDNQRNQQTPQDSLVYCTPNFTRKSSKAKRREAKASAEESIYTDVRALGLD